MMEILQLIDVYKDGGAEKVYDLCASYFASKQNSILKYRLYGSDIDSNKPIPLIKKTNSSSTIGKIIDQRKAIKLLREILMEANISHIFSFLDRSNTTVISACSKIKYKPAVTVTVHNPPNLQYIKLNKIMRFFVLKSIAKKYNKKWVKVIAVSETIKYSLISIGVKKVEVVYNPLVVDQKKLSEQLSMKEKDYFLAIGRLENQKAYWKLLKAYSLYLNNENSSKVDLVLLGEGSHKEKLIKLTENLGISNKVHFEGYISNPFPYYKNCKCLVFSSLFEGFPVTLVEAMSLKKPYIGSDDSIPIEYRQYLNNNGLNCSYETMQINEDYSVNINSDEIELSKLMNKVDINSKFQAEIGNLGYEWYVKNASIENFLKYV